MQCTEGQISSGHVWYTNDPPPSPPNGYSNNTPFKHKPDHTQWGGVGPRGHVHCTESVMVTFSAARA